VVLWSAANIGELLMIERYRILLMSTMYTDFTCTVVHRENNPVKW